MRFSQSVAVVTGAGGGIGSAVTNLLLAEGAQVVAVDISAASLVTAFSTGTDRLMTTVADVSDDRNAFEVIEETVERFGTVGVLVNAAGILGEIAPLERQEPGEFDRVMEVNVKGTWLMMRNAVPHMRAAGGGAIINLASTASKRGAVGLLPYVASKHAVVGLTRTAALELAETGIRVNAVAPGPTNTPMLQTLNQLEGVAQEARNRKSLIAMRRHADPDEVAAAVAFLASGAASYITGAVLDVDGGRNAGTPSVAPPN